jgi:hypothetical protein
MPHDPSAAGKARRTVGLIALASEQCPDISGRRFDHHLNAREAAPAKGKS